MYLITVIALSALFGGLFLYLSFRILRQLGWFMAWLRGSAGILFFVLALFIFLVGFDLSSYQELLEEKPIASLNFEQIGDQKYRIDISYYVDREAESFDIFGDQWQVDARIIRWNGMLGALGVKPGFRLDRISGRYYSLEDEREKERSVYSLLKRKSFFDVWQALQDQGNFVPWIDASYGSAAFLPMADRATYQLSLSHNGLTAKPVNEIAKSAVAKWH